MTFERSKLFAALTKYGNDRVKADAVAWATLSQRKKRMKYSIIAVLLMLGFSTAIAREQKETEPVKTIYDFTMKDIDGKDTSLSNYSGKVVMMVNVASKCGFTSQYEGLEKLYQKYAGKGFVILGFPANNFMGQEPGTDAEIKAFCSSKYNVTFPMFSKISVKGRDIHPLYQFLTSKTTDPEFAGDISWNFNKFLIGRDGHTIARFGSRDAPEDDRVVKAVEAALKP
jgi:glutathione peroxidase